MRIPACYAPLMSSALLSAIMVCIVSAFVLATTQGAEHEDLPVISSRAARTSH